MKKILLLALVFVNTTVIAQNKCPEIDSLKYASAAYKDTADAFFNILMDFEVEKNDAKLEAQTLRSLNDSLVSKINKMLVFHYYACQIIQEIYSDGKIKSKVEFIEAIKQYHNYYKNIPK